MKTQMTLIYAKQTGNVLAVVTRAAGGGGTQPGDLTEEKQRELEQQELADLVGAELLVRNVATGPATPSDAEFAVPAASLGVFTTDADASVIRNFRDFAFDATEKQLKPLATASPPTVVIQGGNAVKVTLFADATEDTAVWVLVQAVGAGLPKSQVAKGVILKTDADKRNKTMTIQALTPTETYALLALVTGFVPVADEDTA